MKNQMLNYQEIPQQIKFCEYIAQSPLIPDTLRARPDSILVAINYGREIGLDPMVAINNIFVVNGKPTLSANIMLAKIEQSGLGYIEILEETAEKCVVKAIRFGVDGRNDREYTTSFTFAEAQKAGLVKEKSGWSKFPKDMCFSKALGRAARRLFSDILMGFYVQNEIEGEPLNNYGTPVSEAPAEAKSNGIKDPMIDPNAEGEELRKQLINRILGLSKELGQSLLAEELEDSNDQQLKEEFDFLKAEVNKKNALSWVYEQMEKPNKTGDLDKLKKTFEEAKKKGFAIPEVVEVFTMKKNALNDIQEAEVV